jgi:hypothetical protein
MTAWRNVYRAPWITLAGLGIAAVAYAVLSAYVSGRAAEIVAGVVSLLGSLARPARKPERGLFAGLVLR